jgi:hypothetical protein
MAGIRPMPAERSVAFVCRASTSASRVDFALLASALFLQRFNLPFFTGFGGKPVSLVIAPATMILAYQFASGRMFIQYDRFLWFFLLVLAATSSLLLNFENRMITSYSLFLVLYSLFTLRRPSTADQYKSTLQSFQLMVLILSCIAIAQFPAQLLVNPRKLLMFYGIFPDTLLPPLDNAGVNTRGIVSAAGSLIKSNGIFLAEASTMSQVAACAVLIEVLEFRRRRYLVVLTLGLLLTYSGTGISILLVSLPLAALVNRRAQSSVLLLSLFVIGLLTTEIIHLSMFTVRVGEFEQTGSSGFLRFVAPFWMTVDYFDAGSLQQMLFGNGPGGIGFVPSSRIYSGSGDTWFNCIYEYGLVGTLVFACFFGFCFRGSRSQIPLTVGLVFHYLFTGNNLLDISLLIIIVVLCTLSGPEPQRARADETSQSRSSFVAGAAG